MCSFIKLLQLAFCSFQHSNTICDFCLINIYHYHSEGKAFIDFVIQTRTGKIIPIEIISSDNAKSKSLYITMKKYNLSFAIRFTNDNFKMKNGVKYVPYYASCCINEGM